MIPILEIENRRGQIRASYSSRMTGTLFLRKSLTISCFVWDKRATGQQIIIRPKSAIAGFYKNPEQAISQERAEEIVQAIAKGELCNN
ncbi:hypothetical protein H6G91_26470 [Nostoc muscorum FACHB-395]|nr:hypothetical protein [Desmonostoc muscorum FACHB-395]